MIITYFFQRFSQCSLFFLIIPFTRFNQPRKVTNAEQDKNEKTTGVNELKREKKRTSKADVNSFTPRCCCWWCRVLLILKKQFKTKKKKFFFKFSMLADENELTQLYREREKRKRKTNHSHLKKREMEKIVVLWHNKVRHDLAISLTGNDKNSHQVSQRNKPNDHAITVKQPRAIHRTRMDTFTHKRRNQFDRHNQGLLKR